MEKQLNKKVPAIRFKGFEDSWLKEPFLSRITKIVDFRGRTPKKLGLDWSDSGFLALSALNVKDGYIDYRADTHFGNEELYNAWMKGNDLHKNQVLFTTEAPMGNVAQIPDDRKYILSQRTIAFVTDYERLSEDFLAIILKSPAVYAQLLARASGGTAKGVSQRSLASCDVILSDNLEEQIKIGHYFKSLDQALTLHQHKHDKLIMLKQAMLQKMFPQKGAVTPEIRFEGFEDKWEVIQLDRIAKFSKGRGYSKSDLVNVGMPIILYGRLYTNYTTSIEDVDTFVVEKEGSVKSTGVEVIIPASGETAEDIARASAVIKEGFILGGDLNVIIPDVSLDSSFLALTLSNGTAKKELARKAQGKSVVHLRRPDLESIQILCPQINEQRKIVKYFQKLDLLINQHATQLEKLKQIKAACLARMFV